MNLTYQTIKHERFKDVAFYVQTHYEVNDKHLLGGYWINQGFVESWIIEKDIIILDNFNEWLICETPEDKCIRYSKWKSI